MALSSVARGAAELHSQWQPHVPNDAHKGARGKHHNVQACMFVLLEPNKSTHSLYLPIYKVALYTNSEAGVKDIVDG
jgi:hypothetical protein